MGITVRQKVPGKGNPYHVFVHVGGIIRSKAVGDKRVAEAVARSLKRRLALGEFNVHAFAQANAPDAAMPTFAQFVKRFQTEYVQVALKVSTAESYGVVLEHHLVPEWGARPLDSIRRADVKTLLLKKQKDGFKAHNLQIVASSVLNFAVECELLKENPARRTGKFVRKIDKRKDIRPLTKEQVATFLEGAQKYYPDSYPLLLCLFRTGLRMGEAAGLRWADVNFNENCLEVRQTYLRGRIDSPKSHKSRRVDLSDQLKLTLLGHRQKMLTKFGKLPEPVFTDTEAGYLHSDNFRHRVFVPLIKKLNMPRFRIHDARHTFASLLLGQGAPILYVKEQMGHSSIQITADRYGSLIPGANRNEVNRLDDPREAGLRIAN